MISVEQLHKKLILIPSLSGDENEVGNFITNLLIDNGFEVKKDIVDNNGFNIIATLGKPKVFLSAHMDTVAPFLDYKETKTEIFGRGACDTKNCIASMLTAGFKAKNDGLNNFGFIFTVGEETDFRGAKKIVKSGIKIPFVVVGEPTSLDIINSHYGILTLKLIAKGKAAHSSQPEKGINAIDILLESLEKIKKIKFHPKTLASLTKISGGVASNIIPNKAEVLICIRNYPDDEKNYFEEFKKLLPNLLIEEELKIDSVITKVPKELAFVKNIRSVKYGTELSLFKNGVVIGPGNIKFAHSEREKIGKKELNKAVEVYYRIIKNFTSF